MGRVKNNMEIMEKKKKKINTLDVSIVNNLVLKNLPLAKKVYKNRKGSNEEAYSFIISCLEILFKKEFSAEKLEEIITDGGEDKDIDVFYDDDEFIHIMDCKNSNRIETNLIENFCKNLNRYILEDPGTNEIKKLNPYLESQLEKFHKEKTNFNKKIKIYVIRNSENKFQKKDKDCLDGLKIQYDSVEELFFENREELIGKFSETENYLNDWEVKLFSKEDKLYFSKDKKELIIKLSLLELINLKKLSADSKTDLFNKNIRVFANNKNLALGIIDTIKESPDNFHIFHNGIVIIVNSIKSGNSNSFKFKNPQIINGCQTVNTLYETYKNDLDNEKIKKAKVICKIYRLEENMIEKVCEASNTQVKISNSDLRSNDFIQLKIEKYINNIPKKNYYYERKKTKKKIKNKILITDFAQWYYACVFEEPADAKNKKAKLFDVVSENSLYKLIFNEKKIKPKNIELICDIGLLVRNKKTEYKKDEYKLLKYADLHIMAGMYLKKIKSEYGFNEVFKIVKKVTKNIMKKNPKTDLNKIFTKNKNTWKLIKNKL